MYQPAILHQDETAVLQSFELFGFWGFVSRYDDVLHASQRVSISPPKVQKVARRTNAIVLDRLIHVNGLEGYALIAHSKRRLPPEVDVATGDATAAIKT
jgi:hypothetical protein